jgi:hypothetical protein
MKFKMNPNQNEVPDNMDTKDQASVLPSNETKTVSLPEFIMNGKKIRQERINRVKDRFRKLGMKAHRGTTARVAMDRRLTPTQFYTIQSQMPAQIAYALTEARSFP